MYLMIIYNYMKHKQKQKQEFERRIREYKDNDRKKILSDINNPKGFMFIDNGIAPVRRGAYQ